MTVTEPRPPEFDQPASSARPQQCATCRGLIVQSYYGWIHVDAYGAFIGWQCPPPHMRLAEPNAPYVDVAGQDKWSSPEPAPPPIPPRADRLTEIPPSRRREPAPTWPPEGGQR